MCFYSLSELLLANERSVAAANTVYTVYVGLLYKGCSDDNELTIKSCRHRGGTFNV